MTTLSVYKVYVSRFEKQLEEEELNGMAMVQGLKRGNQDFEPLESGNKLAWHTPEEAQYDNGLEGNFSMHFVNQVVEESKLVYIGLTMSFVQRFWSWSSGIVFELCVFSCKNVQEWKG